MNPIKKLKSIAKQIRLLILDVDGVLTNGKLYYGDHDEILAFHIHDGAGIKLLQKNNIIVAVISGRSSNALKRRLKELDIQHALLGQENKLQAYQTLLAQLQLQDHEVAYVGDDIADGDVMKKVAFPIAVSNAISSIKKIALWCTTKKGGHGAVREVSDLLLS